jgi:hypothetical protein
MKKGCICFLIALYLFMLVCFFEAAADLPHIREPSPELEKGVIDPSQLVVRDAWGFAH